MLRNSVLALLIAAIALSAGLVVSNPTEAQSFHSNCPAMTESITRLYHAYFGRAPDTNGFRHWVSQYQSGHSLEQISDTLARSNEFGDKRSLSNRTFVNWIYTTVVGPDVDPERKGYWIEALEDGYPRSSMMLAFSESREYVTKTGTAIPLAGYLRWYPEGTHWYCDVGEVAIPVNPLVGEVWADYYFHNRGQTTDIIELWTLDGASEPNVNMVTTLIEGGFTDYNWDGVFSGDGEYGHSIDVRVGAATEWIVVFYPQSLGPERLGWEIG
ncbi:MAG: DUF4214 domain-containing protein [Actinomycetia bacterium]|nr:DUF4214 domain-containing protein [Actinomycetes bacterium]